MCVIKHSILCTVQKKLPGPMVPCSAVVLFPDSIKFHRCGLLVLVEVLVAFCTVKYHPGHRCSLLALQSLIEVRDPLPHLDSISNLVAYIEDSETCVIVGYPSELYLHCDLQPRYNLDYFWKLTIVN